MSTSTCRFDPQQMSVWFNQTGLCFVSNLQDGYESAKPFLLEQMKKLLETRAWREQKSTEGDVLFHICHRDKRSGREIILPDAFDSFMDPTKASTWRRVFENAKLFEVFHNEKRKRGDALHPDIYLATRPEISNIFYVFQILAPGMLAIHLEYTASNTNIMASRVLPSAKWIKKTYPLLGVSLTGGVDALVAAANNPKIVFLDENKHEHPLETSNETPQELSVASSQVGGFSSLVSDDNDNAVHVMQSIHKHNTSSQQVSQNLRRNLPFPMTFIQPENLKSLQNPGPNVASGDGKDEFPQIPAGRTPAFARYPWNEETLADTIPGSSTLGASQFSPPPSTSSATKAEGSTKGKGKKRSQKKNPRPRKVAEPRYRILEGEFLPKSPFDDLDWSVCDKDCGWCGRCRLMEY